MTEPTTWPPRPPETLLTHCVCSHQAIEHNPNEPTPGSTDNHECQYQWATGICECKSYREMCPTCSHSKIAHQTEPIPGNPGIDEDGDEGYYQPDPQRLLLAQRRETLAAQNLASADAAHTLAVAHHDGLPLLSSIFVQMKADEQVRVTGLKAVEAAEEVAAAAEEVAAATSGIFIKTKNIPRWGDCWRETADGTLCGCKHYKPPSATDELSLWAWPTSEFASAGLFNFHHLADPTMTLGTGDGS